MLYLHLLKSISKSQTSLENNIISYLEKFYAKPSKQIMEKINTFCTTSTLIFTSSSD